MLEIDPNLTALIAMALIVVYFIANAYILFLFHHDTIDGVTDVSEAIQNFIMSLLVLLFGCVLVTIRYIALKWNSER